MKTANQYLAAHANMKYALQMYMYKQEILMTKCLYLVLAHLTRSFRVFFFFNCILIIVPPLSLLSHSFQSLHPIIDVSKLKLSLVTPQI